MSNRELYMDHVRQNFWKEMVAKESMLRQEWHDKYSKTFIKEVAASSAKPAVRRKRRQTAVPQPNSAVERMREVVKADEARCEFPSLAKSSTTSMSASDSASSSSASLSGPLESMRPPSARTKQLLYTGLSHHGEGRQNYLKQRKYDNVENRFVYPITNTQEYGWKIQESMDKFKPSDYGRGSVIRDSFYRHRGVFHGPASLDTD